MGPPVWFGLRTVIKKDVFVNTKTGPYPVVVLD